MHRVRVRRARRSISDAVKGSGIIGDGSDLNTSGLQPPHRGQGGQPDGASSRGALNVSCGKQGTMRGVMRWFVAAGWLWLLGLTSLGLLGYGVRRHNFEAAGIAFVVVLLLFSLSHLGHWRDAPPSPEAPLVPRPQWVTLAPAALAAAAFGWTVSLGPLSDDFVLRKWAVAGEWIPPDWNFVRPLPLGVWQLLFGLGGSWAAIHLVNVLLHVVNSALVAHIGDSWLGPRAGVSAGIIFALFPTSTEAVGWSAGVFDLASTAFALGAVAVWLSRSGTAGTVRTLLLLCAGGLLSKETGLAIPLLLLLVVALSPTRPSRLQIVQVLIAGLLSVAYLAIRASTAPVVAGHLQNLPGDRRQWKDLLVRPFSGLTVPMRTDEGVDTAVYVGGLLLLTLFAIAAIRVSRASSTGHGSNRAAAVLCLGVGWVTLSTLPLLLSFYVAPNLEGSRYLYLPSAGFALAASVAFDRWGGSRLNVVASLALAGLLALFVTRLNEERHLWVAAASIRDALLTDAARVARAQACGSLAVRDAPDAVRGVFVFREGLAVALDAVATVAGGRSCELRWTGSALTSADPP